MKKFLTLLFILIAFSLNAQIVHHQHYTTYYNANLRTADRVEWDLTPAMVGCQQVPRKDKFVQDPKISNSASPRDYVNSGYDRGHLFSYKSASCDPIDRIECFYMSNMLPQEHSFNAGTWGKLEDYERALAAKQPIHVIAGGIGSLGRLPAGENIPAFMYKVIKVNGLYVAWIMPNSHEAQGVPLDHWKVSIATLNAKTGLKLQ